MIIKIASTGAEVDVSILGDRIAVTPGANFDHEDPRNQAGISDLLSIVKSGRLLIEKSAVIAAPNTQQPTQTQATPPDGESQLATAKEVKELQQKVDQLTQLIQQATGAAQGQPAQGQQTQPAPTQPAQQPQAQPAPQPQQAPAAPQGAVPKAARTLVKKRGLV